MNFKSVIVVGLGLATVALSLPARADQANVIRVQQQSITTGTRNFTSQDSKVGIVNSSFKTRDSRGNSLDVFQGSDTAGKGNRTNQTSDIQLRNTSRFSR
jgi:polyphosphate kinase 2 (PPK2 family)